LLLGFRFLVVLSNQAPTEIPKMPEKQQGNQDH